MEESKSRLDDGGSSRNNLTNALRVFKWRRHKSSQRLEQITLRSVTQVASDKESPPTPSLDLLPVELWFAIFEIVCRDTLREYLDRDALSANPSCLHLTPITLSHVSQSWNQAIISHPLLWSNVFVHIGAKSSESLLELWLARSQSVMLSIRVQAAHSKQGIYFDAKAFLRCITMLHNHSKRWRTIAFNLCDSAAQLWETIFFTITSNGDELIRTWRPVDLPFLEEVEVNMLGYTYLGKEIDFLSLICSSSKLHTIRIHGANVPGESRSSKTYQPRGSTISSLCSLSLRHVQMPSVESFVLDLSESSHLRALVIHKPHCIRGQPFGESLSTPRRTQLHRITRLSVVSPGIDDSFWTSLFFQSISLPSLEDFTLFSSHDLKPVQEMMQASRCNIRKLTIQTNATDIAAELAFLTTAPSFKHLIDLTIDTTSSFLVPVYDGLFDSMRPEDYITELSNTLLLLPDLTRLTLIVCRATDGCLATLARSRLQNGHLTHLCVEVLGKIGDHLMDLEVFRELYKLGFHAYIYFFTSV